MRVSLKRDGQQKSFHPRKLHLINCGVRTACVGGGNGQGVCVCVCVCVEGGSGLGGSNGPDGGTSLGGGDGPGGWVMGQEGGGGSKFSTHEYH